MARKEEDSATTRQNLRILEALLFASTEPMESRILAERLPDGANVGRLLATLEKEYAHRGVHLVSAGNRWAFRTAPDLAGLLRIEARVERKLSRAAVETLAIIAYHQPVTRAEIEEIRGVALSKGTLDILFAAGWIHPRGRKQAPGRPALWGTTPIFLDHFGLGSLDDLPGVEELKAAGLLDARPAIAAYGARAEEDGEPVDIEDFPEPGQEDAKATDG
ncbi:MAG: SMC-Scp complex subunit ScpB [Alphaproteobacteria bacterium]